MKMSLISKIGKKLEKVCIGYNRGELTPRQMYEILGKRYLSFEDQVHNSIQEIESLIVANGKDRATNIIFPVFENQNEEVLGKALDHFKDKGFRVLKKNLLEEFGEDTEFVIISWKDLEKA